MGTLNGLTVGHQLHVGLAPAEKSDRTANVGIVAKRLAELIHGRVQAMLKIDEGVPRPEFGAELFTQHDLRRAFKQQPQNLQRLPVEPDSASVLAKLPGARIKLKGAKALWRGRLRNFCHDQPGFARSLTSQSAPGKDSLTGPRPPD